MGRAKKRGRGGQVNVPLARVGAFGAPVGVVAAPPGLAPVEGPAPGAVATWPDVVTFQAWERDPEDVQAQLKVARAAWVADMAEARRLGVEVDEGAAWHDWRHWMQFYAPPLDDRSVRSHDRAAWEVLALVAEERGNLQRRVVDHYVKLLDG